MKTVQIKPIVFNIPLRGQVELTSIKSLSISGLSLITKDFMRNQPFLNLSLGIEGSEIPYEISGSYPQFGEELFAEIGNVIISEGPDFSALSGSIAVAEYVVGVNLMNNEVYGNGYEVKEEEYLLDAVKQLPQDIISMGNNIFGKIVSAKMKVYTQLDFKSVKLSDDNALIVKLLDLVCEKLVTEILS